ncbi:MAG: tyrosine-protein phosphatase [Acidobacteriia bacterium]|nr:tyrosine-protein phosphatase [Terriglobia bacterium]
MFRFVFPRAFLFCVLTGAAAAQDVSGVPNFHPVNAQVFRGAQPTPEGFQQLARLGIKTIIDLREPGERSLAEKRIVEANGMHYISLPMRGLGSPAPEQIPQLLRILNDSSAGPVFVHCRRGADRTGTVLACYRIAHDGWENRKALAEARSFGMAWFERSMQHYVLQYKPGRDETASAANLPVNPAPALALAPAN